MICTERQSSFLYAKAYFKTPVKSVLKIYFRKHFSYGVEDNDEHYHSYILLHGNKDKCNKNSVRDYSNRGMKGELNFYIINVEVRSYLFSIS